MLSGGMVLKSYELTTRNGEGREKEGKSLDPQFIQKLGESSLTAFASSASPPESLLYHDSMAQAARRALCSRGPRPRARVTAADSPHAAPGCGRRTGLHVPGARYGALDEMGLWNSKGAGRRD